MLDIQQKAAAWEKPESHLSIEEMLYVSDPNAYDSAQEGCFDLEKLGKMQHQSAWVDVERKAKRILDNNQVDLYHKRPYDLEVPLGPVEIYGNIKGDHARYDAKIILPHPRSRAVRTWACQCTWARYVWNRAPAYKKFEGRLCSHVLALWWRSFNLPVEYEDVRPEVLHYYFPEMVGQQRLFDVDKYEAAEAVINKARIAPDIASSVYGIDLNILNKSLQSAFELVTAEEVISEIENKLDSLFAILFDSETSAEEIEQARDEFYKSLEQKNVYDNQESVEYKKEIANKIIEIVEYQLMIQEYDARLPEIEQRLRSIRATRTRQVDIQEKNEREKKELLAEKQNILDQKQNILPRMNMLITDFKFFRTNLQEIYDNNIAAEKQPRIKAEDAYKYFGWFAEHQQELGQKYADELRRAQRPALEIFEEMQREILSRASLQEIPELITPGVKVTPKFRTEEQEEEREKQPDLIPGQTQMPLASFSVITSSVPVKDIILYIQNELLQGNPINGYIRKEMWGEQRGGLCPHPDAQPIRVRDDGTFIYSPDDLGYDPETGAMGCSKEERGTYAGIPIGSPVKIIAVDPQSRMIKGDFQLDGEPPNHSHIHVWISLKDIDLI